MQTPEKQKSHKPRLSNAQVLARFSGIALRMLTIILLGVALGFWLDSRLLVSDFKIFTVSTTILSVVLAVYLSVRGL
ncbi:MAG: hypothetical protein RIS47_195 [Bacteroidota bacterium]|jgi:succinate dehydrogenase hydrophobic anchor subunit